MIPMSEYLFKPEYNKFLRFLSSKWAQFTFIFLFAFCGILNLFFQNGIIGLINAILYISIAVIGFYSYLKGSPIFQLTRDHHFIKLSSDQIIANTGFLGIEQTINLSRLKTIKIADKKILLEYSIGTHDQISLRVFNQEQRGKIKQRLKKIAKSNGVEVID